MNYFPSDYFQTKIDSVLKDSRKETVEEFKFYQENKIWPSDIDNPLWGKLEWLEKYRIESLKNEKAFEDLESLKNSFNFLKSIF